MKIIGYFKDNNINSVELISDKLLYFVAYENSYNDNARKIYGNKKWIEGYNVYDGHFEIKNKKYLDVCEKISKDQYLKATKGWYTPEIYL